MKTVTADEFLATRCICYSEKKVRAIAGDKKEWSALDVLALENVPAEDRLYAVLDESFIEAPILREAACRFAERAFARVKNPDPRSAGVIVTVRKYERGEATDEELEAARTAARDAWNAAEDAAEAAAWIAALYAARTAARTAAEAARNAAEYAAEYAEAAEAARHAECEEQVKILIALLKETEGKNEK